MSGLLILPTELIEQALKHLDHHSLLECRRVCRRLHALVDGSTAIQFAIAIGFSGQEDGIYSLLGVSERLKMLADHQTAWRKLQWREYTCVPAKGEMVALQGGVYVESDSTHRIMLFTQLHSHLRGIDAKEWQVHLEFPFMAAAIDPSQDLLVTVGRDASHHIYLLSLSSGDAHPAAIVSSISPPAISQFNDDTEFRVFIDRDRLGILAIIEDDRELMIWNWKTGTITMWLAGTRFFSQPVFLDERFVLVGRSFVSPADDHHHAELIIYDLQATSPQRMDVANAPYHCTFQFPPNNFILGIITDPSTDWEPRMDLRVPFRASPKDRLLFVHDYSKSLFIRSQSLLDLSYDPRSCESRHIWSWSTWCSARLDEWEQSSRYRPTPVYGCVSYMRYVENLRIPAPGDNWPRLRVHDFHPGRTASHKDLILPFGASARSMIMLSQDTLIVYEYSWGKVHYYTF